MNAASHDGIATVSEYFNMLATKVQQSRFMSLGPVCDLSKAQLPVAPNPLPPPSEGLVLRHVALGRGTQNYTCANETAAPEAAGAVAVLFNASCIASTYPDLAKMLSKVSMAFNLTSGEATRKLAPSNLAYSGQHFFVPDKKTPFFNLDSSPRWTLGQAPCAKEANVSAPADAPVGQKGEKAVDWLKLLTKPGATGGLQEVYRVETAGGSPPKTCQGLPPTFEVQYAAQYWFYGK